MSVVSFITSDSQEETKQRCLKNKRQTVYSSSAFLFGLSSSGSEASASTKGLMSDPVPPTGEPHRCALTPNEALLIIQTGSKASCPARLLCRRHKLDLELILAY